VSELESLFAKADAAAEANLHIPDFEQSYDDVLTYICDHPESHSEAFDILRRMLVTHAWPEHVDLIEYLVHTLRWDALRRIALERAQSGDPRYRYRYHAILRAFDDTWESRGLYARYPDGAE
jgi:hypothetical protein